MLIVQEVHIHDKNWGYKVPEEGGEKLKNRGKGLLAIVVVGALIAGGAIGFLGLTSQTAEGDDATLTFEGTDHHSTEIRGVYVVASGDSSAALNDNLESDPSGLVVASFTSDGGSASVDWGTEYQLIIYTYGEENEVSNDIANLRCGIDGDYWPSGGGNGSVAFPGDNCSEEERLTTGDDGFAPASDPFLVNGDNHIAVNYLGNSTGFTLARDETASIDEILLQAYY